MCTTIIFLARADRNEDDDDDGNNDEVFSFLK
jgi:hypothetical protein